MMKASVAIVLIVMGTLLIITPAISDYFQNQHVTNLLAEDGTQQVTLHGRMSEAYRLGCWVAGMFMIVVAVAGSISKRHDKEKMSKN